MSEKRGRGRPPMSPSERCVTKNVTLSPVTIDILRQLGRDKGMMWGGEPNISAAIDHAAMFYLRVSMLFIEGSS